MLNKARWTEENAAGQAAAEPNTIGDEMVQRLINVDNHLVVLHERLSILADSLMGSYPVDSCNEAAAGAEATRICPPLIERLSGGIHTLERQAARIEQTINRFNGLV